MPSHHQIIVSSYHRIIISLYHRIILSSYHHFTISSYHHIIVSSNHHMIISPYHQIIIPSNYDNSFFCVLISRHYHTAAGRIIFRRFFQRILFSAEFFWAGGGRTAVPVDKFAVSRSRLINLPYHVFGLSTGVLISRPVR